MTNIFGSLLMVIKTLLPFLMSAAEKAVKKLPKESQEKLIQISKLVEVLKQIWQAQRTFTTPEVQGLIFKHTGLYEDEALELLKIYFNERGIDIETLSDAIQAFYSEAGKSGDTGLKSFLKGIVDILGEVWANIDWKVLALGIVQAVFTNSVKGKVKI